MNKLDIFALSFILNYHRVLYKGIGIGQCRDYVGKQNTVKFCYSSNTGQGPDAADKIIFHGILSSFHTDA